MASGNPIYDKIKQARASLTTAARSSKGKDVLMYLLFVVIAFVFWVLLSLDSEVTKDYEVPIEIAEVPDSVHLLGNVPSTINVSVRGKGAQLIRYEWGTMPKLSFKFKEYATRKERMSISRIRLDARLRDYFGNGVVINTIKPDTLGVAYTTNPGVRMPLHVVADINPDLQYTLSGSVTASTDSVTVYSMTAIPEDMKYVVTEPVSISGIKDTAQISVGVRPVPNAKIVPSTVEVTIPVEPLISKRRQTTVDVVGLPPHTSLITFPSKVTFTYLVPMSAYNKDYPLRAYVDYDDVNTVTKKIPVRIGAVPPFFSGVTVTPDSVEYIIEKAD